MSDSQVLAFAARHPEYVVLVDKESTQGGHWWHVRADGSKCCEGSASGKPTRSEHAEIVSRVGPKHLGNATHVVYITGGSRVRVAV